MSFFSNAIAGNLRKPGGGLAGRIVTYFLKKKNHVMEIAAVENCKIEPNDFILELGFGPGIGLKDAAEKVRDGEGKVYGIDFSPVMMAEAMNLLEAEVAANKVQLTLGNVEDLPYRDNSIDTVFHCNCYYFWEDRATVLKSILRVLKPCGKMITVLNKESLQVAEQRGFLKEDQYNHNTYMEQLKANNFEDVNIQDYTMERFNNFTCQVITATKPT